MYENTSNEEKEIIRDVLNGKSQFFDSLYRIKHGPDYKKILERKLETFEEYIWRVYGKKFINTEDVKHFDESEHPRNEKGEFVKKDEKKNPSQYRDFCKQAAFEASIMRKQQEKTDFAELTQACIQ